MSRMRLILASASPRRSELLAAAGLAFVVRPVEVDETPLPRESAADYVTRLAMCKARSARSDDGDVVLAADTTVVAARTILGKPVDEADARRMLGALGGREHEVLTGVAIRHRDDIRSSVEVSVVRFLPLSPADIDWYVASGEPFDKAGAYAIQGLASRFVDRVEGSYSNVVGLPVSRVCLMLGDLLGPGALASLSAGPHGPSL
jgi:septum formation protein